MKITITSIEPEVATAYSDFELYECQRTGFYDVEYILISNGKKHKGEVTIRLEEEMTIAGIERYLRDEFLGRS